MAELEKIPERGTKFSDLQGKYNSTSKTVAQRLGTNIALYICILIPMVLIGFIWTDFGTPQISIKYVSEGIVTVALFFIGETMMMNVGTGGGKLDKEYTDARDEFKNLLDEVDDIGTILLSVFCEWQIDVELMQAIVTRLRPLHLTRADWDKVKDMSFRELKQEYGRKKAKKIRKLNRLDPVELSEGLLLYDNTDDLTRGGVPISGNAYLHKKTHSPETVFSCLFTGLLTISVAITMTQDVTMARVIYTIFKLVVLLYRMAVGYSMGAKAFNTIEVRQIKAKCNYLRQYVKFVKDKLYLNLGDKYGDLRCFVGNEIQAQQFSSPDMMYFTQPIQNQTPAYPFTNTNQNDMYNKYE